jgi:N-acetylglucosamine kinase-like BadF-type ATPase
VPATAAGHLLGIDGGQTSTTAALARLDGTVIWIGAGGPQDHLGAAGGEATMRAGLAGALAGVPADVVIRSVVAGMTNVDDPDPRTALIADVIGDFVQAEEIAVAADRVTCWAGASGGRPSAVVIAGGGSIAYGDNGRGRRAFCGGWGYLLGDEGSATNVGLRAVSTALRAVDGRAGGTALVDLVRAEFAVTDFVEVKRLVYDAAFARSRFGLLAPKVVALAAAGDAAALEIVTTAGVELGRLAVAVLDRVFGPSATADVHLVGGMFAAGKLLLDSLRAELAGSHPAATARRAEQAPLLGSLVLAARHAGIDVGESWTNRARTSLEISHRATQ